jgi:hypothetical protein
MPGNLPLDSLDRFAEYQKNGPDMERRKFVYLLLYPKRTCAVQLAEHSAASR